VSERLSGPHVLRSGSLGVADRDALVEQALNDGFKAFLPNEPRVRIRTANIDPNKRLYVATQQTMGLCYDRFSPAFFDLIVFDEAHRSIFNRFTEVIEYFDARMFGLTATPAAFMCNSSISCLSACS
jgi:type I restriction enzyme, R subunit